MTANNVYEGEFITIAAPYAVSSGEGAKSGQIFGIAAHDADNAATVSLATEGVFDILKETDAEFSVGDIAYWDDVNKDVSPDAAIVGQGNTKIGVVVMDAAAADATVRVRLNGSFVASEAALPGV